MDVNEVKSCLDANHLENIEKAAENVKPVIVETPLIRSDFYNVYSGKYSF